MKITYATKRQDVTSEFVTAAERKLKKFDRFFKDDATALIKTDKKKNGESVELTISCGGTLYRSEKRADTMNNALDETIEAILRQIRKNKTRLEKKLKEGAFVPAPEETEEPVEEHPEFKVRTKSFPVKPMSTEDAILQMLLLEHDFFLFCNPDTGALNVVYRRADGDYGLIIPD
ncbi:MAG: ribosome-associated translation inhibitor RaiA [Clostridia bacterium]|nr:ribosome-associated translation inhibitor RaiA [Clostridia bacterium]